MFTLSEWPVSLESYCRIPSWNAKQFDPLGMMSDLQTISGQRKNGWSMVHIIASFMFWLFRYKSLLCLITLMYRFNHHYGGTDVYKFTFDIRVDVWFLDELHWIHCGIHYKTDARALLLQKSETRTSAVQGTDECTMAARPGRAMSRQQRRWAIVKHPVELPC